MCSSDLFPSHDRSAGIKKAVDKLTKEETELQEISQDTKNEYAHKSFAQGNELHKKLKTETDPEERAKISAQISKRNQGIIRAAKKLKEETSNDFSIEDFSVEELEEFLVSEEYEQLDEISKKTLGSYIKKAHDTSGKYSVTTNDVESDRKTTSGLSTDYVSANSSREALSKVRGLKPNNSKTSKNGIHH